MASGDTRARRKQKESGFNRKSSRSFALAMLLVLVFALIYTFFGGRLFPGTTRLTLADGEIIVAILDVGQGDSTLIWSRDNAVLIDGGEFNQRNTVLGYLRRAGITHLDYVIATHPHSDHIGGLVAVLAQVDVGKVLMPEVSHTSQTFANFLDVIENNNIPVTAPIPGERFQAGIIDITVLAPPAGINFMNLNNASIILRLNHGGVSFLFTGDAEAAAERALMASGQDISVDVLHVGHHGSRTSTTPEFLYAVNPVAAVISLGRNNRFNHPHHEVMDLLTTHGVQVYRTDEMGTVKMATDGERIILME